MTKKCMVKGEPGHLGWTAFVILLQNLYIAIVCAMFYLNLILGGVFDNGTFLPGMVKERYKFSDRKY